MRLLIVTQAVDKAHPVLGFFHDWIERFAASCESVEVICLYEGTHALPANVRVHSLGKEGGRRHPILYAITFLSYVWRLRASYDTVFVHMNPEYVVLAGWLWRLMRRPVGLWYLHKSVTLRLKIAIAFATVVFTASAKSLRVETPKKRVVGHGVLVDRLPAVAAPASDHPISLLTIGRLSPVKRVELLIRALRNLPVDTTLTVVGGAAGSREVFYAAELRALAEELGLTDRVFFVGAQPHTGLGRWYGDAHLFVHASDTGSLDKVLLEALARGVPVVTTNHELASEAGEPLAYFSPPAVEMLTKRIGEAIDARVWADPSVRERARAYVATKHELSRLIPGIVTALSPK